MMALSPVWYVFGALMGLATAQKRPHIVIILVDDLGHDDVSFHGSNQIPTPNIDALAYDGIILNNYYTNRICTPSRAALMTGRHPTQLGLQHEVIGSSEPYGLGLNETILPEYLKKLGYATHMIGKWHLGFYAKEFTPTYRGFDSFFGYFQGKEDYYDHTYQGYDNSWGLDFRNNTEPAIDKFGQYSTELFAEEAVNIISKHDNSKPLFMYLPYQGVHAANAHVSPPLEAPWKYIERFPHISSTARQIYAGMVSAVDDAVGDVVRALQAKGMLNDSVIFFSTDNGGPADGFDKNQASNWPLRGMKFTLWEGGMKGDGFMWSPSLAKSGYTSEHMMQIEDVLPTLLHAAGYDPASLPGDLYGKDMWHALSHNLPGPRHEMLHNTDRRTGELAMRSGDMKVITSDRNAFTAKLDGWYYPPQFDTDMTVTNRELYQNTRIAHEGFGNYGLELLQTIDEGYLLHFRQADRSYDEYSLRRRATNQRGSFRTNLPGILSSLGRPARVTSSPVTIDCGKRPVNETNPCRVGDKPCLFNITADPCEYKNLAESHPDILTALYNKVKRYQAAAAPPKNKPSDPKGLPQYHGGVWGPWIELTNEETSVMRNGKIKV